MAVQTNDVVLLLSSSQHRNFARISSTKIISITPFTKMSALANTSHKNNAKIVTNERKNKACFDFHCECGLFSRFASNVVKRI